MASDHLQPRRCLQHDASLTIVSVIIQHKKVRERHPDSAKAEEGTLYF